MNKSMIAVGIVLIAIGLVGFLYLAIIGGDPGECAAGAIGSGGLIYMGYQEIVNGCNEDQWKYRDD